MLTELGIKVRMIEVPTFVEMNDRDPFAETNTLTVRETLGEVKIQPEIGVLKWI
jgi:hypothetical protein